MLQKASPKERNLSGATQRGETEILEAAYGVVDLGDT